MNILMLGNSFTYCNDLGDMLARELDASVTEVVRGGAYLHSFLDQEDELSQLGMAALRGRVQPREGRELCRTFGGGAQGMWDYVILQEQSFNAVGNEEDYVRSAAELCRRAWSVGAVPVIYGTWAYRAGSDKLGSTWLTYDEMLERLRSAGERAAREGGALWADVGAAFAGADFDPYSPDDYHPNAAASRLAARTLAGVMRAHAQRARPCPAVELRPIDRDNWQACVRLSVAPEQRDFVAPNAYSLAQAAYEPECHPLAIYLDGSMAGFAMYAWDAELEMWSIYRLMVGQDMQGRGVARAALDRLCALMAGRHGARSIAISADPRNARALGLYRRMGFEPDGRLVDGEILLIRHMQGGEADGC